MDAAREGKATGLIGPMEFLRFQATPVDFWGLTLVQWLAMGMLRWFGYQLTLNRMGNACICDVLPKRLVRKARAPQVGGRALTLRGAPLRVALHHP